jgi:dihydrofolate reductase
MGNVIWHITMSVDGFIAGADEEMSWVFEHSGPDEMAQAVIDEVGAILVGRRTYEVEDRERGGFYGGNWSGPYFVLTHDPPTSPPDWMTGEFIDEGIEDAVKRAQDAAGEKAVVIFGADLARQCIESGLMDEIVIHMSPVLLGDGVRLFGSPASPRVNLERTALAESGQLTDLRFRVANA